MYYLFIGLLLLLLLLCDGNRQSSLLVKRISSELRDITNAGLSLDVPFNFTDIDETGIRLSPLKNNLLEWHFTFTGVEGSAFEGGVYHGIIKLNAEYPQKAPSICLLTQSGRWEVNKDICLSASHYHPETWNPNWNLRTLVLSLRVFMTTQPREIGAVAATPMVQKIFAKQSADYFCRSCGVRHKVLLGNAPADETKSLNIQRKMISRTKKSRSKKNMKFQRVADQGSTTGREILQNIASFMRNCWGVS